MGKMILDKLIFLLLFSLVTSSESENWLRGHKNQQLRGFTVPELDDSLDRAIDNEIEKLQLIYGNIHNRHNSNVLLSECESGCRQDSDCGGQLICFLRSSSQSQVPGCVPENDPILTNYCVKGTEFDNKGIFITPPTTQEPSQSPLSQNFPSTLPSNSPSILSPPTLDDKQDSIFIGRQDDFIVPDSEKVLFTYGGDPPPEAFPLGQCEGDCDSDDDCEGDLICFQRDSFDPVPGCLGGETTFSRTDFCTVRVKVSSIQPSPAPFLNSPAQISPPSGEMIPLFAYFGQPPESAFPLPLCHGDCDTDDDCADGLRCYQKDRFEEVPGCIGGSSDGSLTDYCTYPWSSSPSSKPSSITSSIPSQTVSQNPSFSPSLVASMTPSRESSVPTLGPTSLPSQSFSQSPTPPPSSAPSIKPSTLSAGPSTEPSVQASTTTPSSFPSLAASSQPSWTSTMPSLAPSSFPSLAASSQPSWTSMMPSVAPSSSPSNADSDNPTLSLSSSPSLAKSSNPSFRPSLTKSGVPSTFPSSAPSFQVPSLSPSSRPSRIPSISPSLASSAEPSTKPSANTPEFPSANPSALLQSIPPSKTSPSPSSAPSSSSLSPSSAISASPSAVPSAPPTDIPSTNPSQNPTDVKELVSNLVAYDDLNPPPDALPLSECSGNCGADSDCGEGLYCHERLPGEEVPGCIGGVEDLTDNNYCAKTEFASVAPSNSTFFRMKLGLDGFDWCMGCENGCVVGDTFSVRTCSGRSTYFELKSLGLGEVIMQAAGTDLCLERRDQTVELRPCNSAKIRQIFISKDDSDLLAADSLQLTQSGRRLFCMAPTTLAFGSPVGMWGCSAVSIWLKH